MFYIVTVVRVHVLYCDSGTCTCCVLWQWYAKKKLEKRCSRRIRNSIGSREMFLEPIDLLRWGHYIASKLQEPITRRSGFKPQNNGTFSYTAEENSKLLHKIVSSHSTLFSARILLSILTIWHLTRWINVVSILIILLAGLSGVRNADPSGRAV
jgi:hypothetical protein